MLKFLKKPFPLNKNPRIIIPRILLYGLIIFFFLYVFQPFGLKDHHDLDLLIFSGGFVILGILYLLIYFLLIERHYNESKWNVGKEILNNLGAIIAIGLINALYYSLYEDDELNLTIIWVFMIWTLSIGIIPVIIITLFRQNRLLNLYLQQAKEINIGNRIDEDTPESCQLTLSSKNPAAKFTFNCQDLILLKAQDNYILMYYLKDGLVKKEIIRNTMNQSFADIKSCTDFYRCHRSYIINLRKIESLGGNAQGLKLKLVDVDEIIPVSRHLVKDFTSKMCSIK